MGPIDHPRRGHDSQAGEGVEFFEPGLQSPSFFLLFYEGDFQYPLEGER
jgi:hypothetical protein